jgi:hypothetical protein
MVRPPLPAEAGFCKNYTSQTPFWQATQIHIGATKHLHQPDTSVLWDFPLRAGLPERYFGK